MIATDIIRVMSTHKTKFDQTAAEIIIEDHLHAADPKLETIADGETSQAFLFETEEGPRVLRVSIHSKESFLKDQMAHRQLASAGLPIPEVFEVGEVESGLFFAISERVPGKTLDKFSREEIDALMPKIIETLETIHSVKPLGEGYGNWDLTGNGKFKSWREALIASASEDDEETRMAEFYDEAYHDKLRAEVLALIHTCPEERVLIHDDFGFNNTLSDGTNITGVIDWEHAAYGDPLKDVAWLDFWNDKQGYAAAFEQYYREKNTLPKDFQQRINCYKLLIGLGSLGFFARSRQAESYQYTKEIIDRTKLETKGLTF